MDRPQDIMVIGLVPWAEALFLDDGVHEVQKFPVFTGDRTGSSLPSGLSGIGI